MYDEMQHCEEGAHRTRALKVRIAAIPRLDRLIIGYADRTIGLCSECSAPFVAKRPDAGTCGRSACRMRRSRRGK